MAVKYKIAILILVSIVLGILFSTPLIRLGNMSQSYITPLLSEEILSADEINSFLEVYVDFSSTNLETIVEGMSLRNDKEFPAQVKRWFRAKGWSADRFFAVEQRIKQLISVAILINNIEDNRKLKTAVDGDGLQNIIEQQEQRLKSLKYNQEELVLVKDNLFYINTILGTGIN